MIEMGLKENIKKAIIVFNGLSYNRIHYFNRNLTPADNPITNGCSVRALNG